MSIIVKGMEIPESCGRCDFNVSSLYCNRTGSEIDRDYEYMERLSDCPISALPEKHGRLGDLDALIKQMEANAEHMDEPYARMMYSAAISDVRHTQDIVEAEGGE